MQKLNLWTGHTSSRYNDTPGNATDGAKSLRHTGRHSFARVIEVRTDVDVDEEQGQTGKMGDDLVKSYHDPDAFGKMGERTRVSDRSEASSVSEQAGAEALQLKEMPKVTYSSLN
jgi:hypothetical protein